MTICPTCGSIRTTRRRWGKLLVTRGPAEVYWDGVLLKAPSPLQHSILWTMAQVGQATHHDLEMLSLKESAATIYTSMCHLRRWIRGVGIPLAIICTPNVGYRLQV